MKGVLTFTCDQCGGRYVSQWSDTEAIAECRRIDGDIPVCQMAVLCEPCAALWPHPKDTIDGRLVNA